MIVNQFYHVPNILWQIPSFYWITCQQSVKNSKWVTYTLNPISTKSYFNLVLYQIISISVELNISWATYLLGYEIRYQLISIQTDEQISWITYQLGYMSIGFHISWVPYQLSYVSTELHIREFFTESHIN